MHYIINIFANMSYSYPLLLKQNSCTYMFCLSYAMCIQIIRLSDEWKTYNWVTFLHNIGFLLHQNISQPQKDLLFLHSWILLWIINTIIYLVFTCKTLNCTNRCIISCTKLSKGLKSMFFDKFRPLFRATYFIYVFQINVNMDQGIH